MRLLVVLMLFAVPLMGLGQSPELPPCEWAPGMYWEWQVVLPQSPSWSGVAAVYVLKAERWGDYELDLLVSNWPVEGGRVVRLGAVVRQPCGTMRGFGFLYSDIYRWAFNPPGSVIEHSWHAKGMGQATIEVELAPQPVEVEVSAGVFPECVRLTRRSRTGGELVVAEEETIWFDRLLGWPVRMRSTLYYQDRIYFGESQLVSYGVLPLAETVARVFAALDEMEVLGDPFSETAQGLRGQLLSLGFSPPE